MESLALCCCRVQPCVIWDRIQLYVIMDGYKDTHIRDEYQDDLKLKNT
jgi:predicted metal-binding transcription factor (methanogenesis marker protein 9)